MFNLLASSIKPFDFKSIFSNVGSKWYFYVIGLAVIGLVVLVLLLLRKAQPRNNLSKTQKLVYTAIFSALCFVTNCFTIPFSQVWQASLVALVGFVAGYMLGAGWAFAAAFIGDLIGAIVMPTGAYNPIINVGTAMWGLIPGVIYTLFGKKGNDYLKCFISFVLGFVINSFLINSWGISLMYSISFDKLMVTLPFKLATVGVNFALALVMVAVLPRILPKDKFNFVKKKEKQVEENQQ